MAGPCGKQTVGRERAERRRDWAQCAGAAGWALSAQRGLNDEAALEAALKGAYGVFVVTRVWAILAKRKKRVRDSWGTLGQAPGAEARGVQGPEKAGA